MNHCFSAIMAKFECVLLNQVSHMKTGKRNSAVQYNVKTCRDNAWFVLIKVILEVLCLLNFWHTQKKQAFGDAWIKWDLFGILKRIDWFYWIWFMPIKYGDAF